MPVRLWPALLCLLATPVLAEPWDCQFDTECTTEQGCQAAGLALKIGLGDGGGVVVMSTAMGDSTMHRLTQDGTRPATYAGAGRAGIAELLTIEPDGTAILTLHMFDGRPAAITYFGGCEGAH